MLKACFDTSIGGSAADVRATQQPRERRALAVGGRERDSPDARPRASRQPFPSYAYPARRAHGLRGRGWPTRGIRKSVPSRSSAAVRVRVSNRPFRVRSGDGCANRDRGSLEWHLTAGGDHALESPLAGDRARLACSEADDGERCAVALRADRDQIRPATYIIQSMGEFDSSSTPMRVDQVGLRLGLVVFRRTIRSIHSGCCGPRRAVLHTRASALRHRRIGSDSARARIADHQPHSVLSRAERGSKLNEPTKMRRPSTASVLACRPEDEPEPNRSRSSRFPLRWA